MNTVHVHEFLVLAKLLNYSRAAQALYISQSVLTTHIQALEADLGVRLFDRDSHSVRLTEAGRILVMEAPALLDSVDKAQELLRREKGRVDPIRSKFGEIRKEEVSLDEKLVYLSDYCQTHRSFSFRSLLESQCTKTEIIVTFLAVLELIRSGTIRVVQEQIFDDIQIQSIPLQQREAA